MRKPLVSIMLPYQNHEAYIGRAITSLAEQTYPYIELMLINDSSEDESDYSIQKILKRSRHRFARFHKIENNRTRGLRKTLNNAIKQCTGVYIGILYPSDEFSPKRLDLLVAAMQSQQAAISFSDVAMIDSQSNELDNKKEGWKRRRCIALSSMDRNICVSAGNLLMRRSIWKNLDGFRLSGEVMDWDLFLRSNLYAEPLYVPGATYLKRFSERRGLIYEQNMREKKDMLHYFYAALQSKEIINPQLLACVDEIREEAFFLGHEEVWNRAKRPGARLFIRANWKPPRG